MESKVANMDNVVNPLGKPEDLVFEESTMNDDFIRISVKHYKELIEQSAMLEALQVAGVDNWEGYDEAITSLFDEDYE